MGLRAETITRTGIEISVEDTTVRISGNIDHRNPGEFLEPLFNSVHEQMITKSLKEVTVDIAELGFINSSGIVELTNWIGTMDELEDDDKYKIIFISNTASFAWQKSSLKLLTYLSSGNVLFHDK